jgi:hypothetical protein
LTDNPRHGQQLSRFPFLLARQPKNNSLSPDIFSAKEFHGSPSPPHFLIPRRTQNDIPKIFFDFCLFIF